MEGTAFGAGYGQALRYTLDETVSPLFDPEMRLQVKYLFREEADSSL